MKKIIITLLTCFSLSQFANDLFLYDSNEKTEISEIINNKLTVLPTVNGQTFSLNDGLSIVTKTNDYA